MAESWIAVASDRIEFFSMKSNGAMGGIVRYTPLEGAVVRVDGEEYRVPKGAKNIVLVANSTAHIRIE